MKITSLSELSMLKEQEFKKVQLRLYEDDYLPDTTRQQKEPAASEADLPEKSDARGGLS